MPGARQKRLILIACILGSAIVFIDGTVVNVALPSIRSDLHAGLATQQWVMEAYLLTLGSLILIGGSLSDLYGRRRVFTLGVIGFGATSILCAVAPDAPLLVVARGLQGAAGALLVPSTLAVIIDTFPEDERGAAIGSWTAWGGVSTLIGPLLGGVLIQVSSWRLVFAISLLPVAGTLYLVRRHLPEHLDSAVQRHIDLPGAVLCAVGLAGVVLGLIEQPSRGFGDPLVWGTLAGGGLALAAFLFQEARSPGPMMPPSLFRRRNFAVGNAATLALYGGLGAATFFLPLYLQQVAGYRPVEAGLALLPVTVVMFTLFRRRNFAVGNAATLALYGGLGAATFFLPLYLQQVAGYRPVEAGLALLPVTVVMFALSRRWGALADRLGPRIFMGAGPFVAGAGLLLLLRAGRDAPYFTVILPGMAVFGLGLSITVAPLTAAVLAGVEDEHAGVASGVNNAVARVAGLLAIGAVGAVVAAQFGSSLDHGLAHNRLSAPARAAIERTRGRPLSVAPGHGLGPGERARVRRVSQDASIDAFRAGVVSAALLAALGGAVSAVGIVNPRRRVEAAECPGGALVGASRELAHSA